MRARCVQYANDDLVDGCGGYSGGAVKCHQSLSSAIWCLVACQACHSHALLSLSLSLTPLNYSSSVPYQCRWRSLTLASLHCFLLLLFWLVLQNTTATGA